MSSHRTKYRGRHVAPRRHVAAPLLMTGLVVGTTATVGLPEAAAAFELAAGSGSSQTSISSATRGSAAAADGAASRAEERASRAGERAAVVTPSRIIRGKRLEPKPPPWVLPVQGYHLTARFGATGLWSHAHTGLDFAAPSGTTIRSIAPGTVESASYDGAYGNKTVIRLDDGTELWYCHQTSFAVSTGDRVGIGETIGYVGSTGNVTGPHLHLEVRPGGGEPIDPEGWLPKHGLNP